MTPRAISRRRFVGSAGAFFAAGAVERFDSRRAAAAERDGGYVVGELTAERVGLQVLAEGGNAVDAMVAAALAAAIAAPASTGIGGYGLSAVVAMAGQKIVAVDANTTAAASTPATLFQPDAAGRLPDGLSRSNWLSSTGWLSAGVPGVLAGLQLCIDQFGTRGFGELVQPAIRLARDGFPCPTGLATAIRGRQELFARDPGSSVLYLPHGEPPRAGEPFRNLPLAELLETLARRNSVESFYRGDVAQRIADAFRQHGGLVTPQDMAAYRARLVPPLSWDFGERNIHTAPLTAGGLSVLQVLHTLQVLDWPRMPAGLSRTHARIEAMRLAWRDRLSLLGDPDAVEVPVGRLLSLDYARESASRIREVVAAGRVLAHPVTRRDQGGTIHLSAADRNGNLVALTLTHGNAFGACVTVDGLGLTLGHGVSRFDPDPKHPNAPGPGKRPLHNMVPTVVSERGVPILAVGGTGGRKIPNALAEVLTQFVLLERPLREAMAAPRLHTEGDALLALEKTWPPDEVEPLRRLGYTVTTGGSANMSAVAMENGTLERARR
ncbi:MAG: gamma-glutamyltransferase family protein [Pirellulaceae bacterium]